MTPGPRDNLPLASGARPSGSGAAETPPSRFDFPAETIITLLTSASKMPLDPRTGALTGRETIVVRQQYVTTPRNPVSAARILFLAMLAVQCEMVRKKSGCFRTMFQGRGDEDQSPAAIWLETESGRHLSRVVMSGARWRTSRLQFLRASVYWRQ